jgi:hypothetical protein
VNVPRRRLSDGSLVVLPDDVLAMVAPLSFEVAAKEQEAGYVLVLLADRCRLLRGVLADSTWA